jgi:hypothetical protein
MEAGRNILREAAIAFLACIVGFSALAWMIIALDDTPVVTTLDLARAAPSVLVLSLVATGVFLVFKMQSFVAALRAWIGNMSLVAPVFVTVYVLGVFLFERSGLVPAMRDWAKMAPETVSFFVIYTSAAFLIVSAYFFALRVLRSADARASERLGPKTFAKDFGPFIGVFLVILFVAGLVAAQWLRIGPELGFGSVSDPNFWKFLPIYTIAFVLTPFVIFAVLWGLWRLLQMILSGARGIGGTETWRRLAGAKLSEADFAAALAQERAEREELRAERRRLQRSKRFDKNDRLQQEISDFGAITARFLWWAPVVTFFAQLFSFITSYLGIRIYLDLRAENMVWTKLPIPSVFDLWTPFEIVFRSNDVLAVAASAIMAVIIWGLSSLAVARVRGRQPIPFEIFVFIMVLGAASTYTAFIMWNGELATKEELNLAVGETVQFKGDIEVVDSRNIDNVLRDVSNLETQVVNRREAERATELRGHLLELQQQLDRQSQNFARAVDLRYFLEASKGFQETFRTCEQERGCLSNLAGRGAVVKELEKNVLTFDNNVSILEEMMASRSVLEATARAAAQDAVTNLEKRALTDAQKNISLMRSAMIAAEGEDPITIFRAIDARLSIPISNEAPTESQRQALSSLQDGINAERQKLLGMQADWQASALELPPEIRLDQVGLVLGQDIGLLGQLRSEFEAIQLRRQQLYLDHNAELEAIRRTVRINADEDLLIQNEGGIFARVNGLRGEIALMGSLDLRPSFSKLGLLESEFAKGQASFRTEAEAYPSIGVYQPTILAFSIIKYAYLSVVPLLIQIMVDFGYTLIIVIVAARLKRGIPV